LSFPFAGAFLQLPLLDLLMGASLVSKVVLVLLTVASVMSWTVIFAKWKQFKAAGSENTAFLRAFRKAPRLEAIAALAEQFQVSPLSGVFAYGYDEAGRQVQTRGRVTNKVAVERSLQMGVSAEMARLEHNMSWLATTATVSPFVGLFGTVLGIIDSFQGLGMQGSASLRAVAPGISEALIATAAGLAAAIPAAIAYNQFSHRLRELGARMDDFALEFLNMTERGEE
jgi:biopolymer transport protein TolQ